MNSLKSDEWVRTNSAVFWGEIAVCDHVALVYDNDEVLIKMLAGFVGDGINSDDCVIVIATKEHLRSLEKSLYDHAVSVATLVSENHYVALEVEQCLDLFMRNGWPDKELFFEFVNDLVARVNSKKRKLRVFAEMVTLLWLQGYRDATLRLEQLWKDYCQAKPLSLFCVYPKTSFNGNASGYLLPICNCHTKVISGTEKPLTEIFYRNTNGHKKTPA